MRPQKPYLFSFNSPIQPNFENSLSCFFPAQKLLEKFTPQKLFQNKTTYPPRIQ